MPILARLQMTGQAKRIKQMNARDIDDDSYRSFADIVGSCQQSPLMDLVCHMLSFPPANFVPQVSKAAIFLFLSPFGG
jgi:hypothetical protein